MGTGIMICGLNGSGKSTLGKALAERLHFHFIDSEDLFFSKADKDYPYASPRMRENAEKLLYNEIKANENFVFASVTGDYGELIYPFFRYVILMDAPKDIRLRRVKNRSFRMFGDRILPGGDLYKQEEEFFEFVKSRPENAVEEWIRLLSCPVLKIDGTKSIEENIDLILNHI